MSDHAKQTKPEAEELSTKSHDDDIDIDNEIDQEEIEIEEDQEQEQEAVSFEEYQEQKEKAQQNWDALLRIRAELDNLRKRQARELENARKYALERFLTDLLPVKDSLEAGMENIIENVSVEKLKEGSELTLQMLVKLLDDYQIEEINPLHEKFNPELHEAMTTQESDEYEAETVLIVLQKGYLLNERLVRPARVIVAK